jgi:ribose 5-phosphate isomerase B
MEIDHADAPVLPPAVIVLYRCARPWEADPMRIFLGSDHAGFDLKARLLDRLGELGHEPVDCGAHEYAPGDDYPPYVMLAARRTAGEPGSMGIVIGGSGNGEVIAANKVPGVRAALVWNEQTAALAREHNDANVLGIGGRMHPIEDAVRFVELFVSTPFSDDPRHVRRIDMLTEYEKTGELPRLP